MVSHMLSKAVCHSACASVMGFDCLHKHTTFVPITEGAVLLYSVLLTTNTGITNILFPSEGTAPSASMQPL